jgi:hypothetical protein
MDTVTLIRSAIRGLLHAADAELETQLRAVLRREDDYAVAGKPVCDYDDPDARAALVNALAGDAMALLDAVDGRELNAGVSQAAVLLATPWSVRTSTKTPPECCGSPAASRRTG